MTVAPVVPRSTDHVALATARPRRVVLTERLVGPWAERDNRDRHHPARVARGSNATARREPARPSVACRPSAAASGSATPTCTRCWRRCRLGPRSRPSEEVGAAVADARGTARTRAAERRGYINSYVQGGHEKRLGDLTNGHELYCIGHLIQAGVAYQRVTGGGDFRGRAPGRRLRGARFGGAAAPTPTAIPRSRWRSWSCTG